MEKRKRRSFNAEVKAEAVWWGREGGKRVSQVAKDLDLTDSALRNWLVRAGVGSFAPAGAQCSMAEREEWVRLRNEVRQLERLDKTVGRSRPPVLQGCQRLAKSG